MINNELEKEILSKGLTAPRVTPQRIAQVIKSVYYFTAEEAYFGNLLLGTGTDKLPSLGDTEFEAPSELGLMTFCIIELQNGFKVVGHSACASAENFDSETGKKVAYRNAEQQIWHLEGYLLKENLKNFSYVGDIT